MTRNGYLAEDGIVLVTVEDNDQLIATAAASFRAMKAAAASDGVTLTIVEPAGAYRSAWVQNDMVDHPERYNLNPASSIKFSRYGQSHGWGNRIDVNSAAVPWVLRNAARFGWTREYGARDPNHFKHDGMTATTGGGGGGSTGDEDMMELVQAKGDPRVYHCVNRVVRYHIPDEITLNDYKAFYRGQGLSDVVGVVANIAAFGAIAGTASPITAGASKADVDAAADRVIAQVPPAVVVEQKKPGN